MKKLYLLFVFCSLMLLDLQVVFSQAPDKFSKQPDKFLEEMILFFEDVNKKDKKKSKDFMEFFIEEWVSGKFSAVHKEHMYSICNLMLKDKMRAFPHFYEYLTTVISSINSGQNDNNFETWHKSLVRILIQSNSRQFLSYLEISKNLFTSNVLYSSRATTWKSSNNNYYFEFDTISRIIFPSLDLKCYANDDSSCIYNTSGIYYPTLYKWVGKGGKLDWQRAGFDPDEVWAELSDYEIGIRFSKYTADSVLFYNKNYFNEALLGVVEDKVLADVTEEKAAYPRFYSYYNRFKIENIFKDIDYEGGFGMRGSRLMGAGNEKERAFLTFKLEGKKFIVVSSNTFVIRQDKIASNRATVTIYWENDSIYHPGLEMKYLDENKELSLIRIGEGIAQSPYFDSYHEIDMYVEAMYWKMGEPKIDLELIKGVNQGKATFESSNYFSAHRYFRLQGMDNFNPLDLLYLYSKKVKSKEIYVDELAAHMRKPIEQVSAMLLNLANKGFLIYDIDNEKVIIKDRLFDYLNARRGRTDYDVIQFNSQITGLSNATLSLLNFDLKLRGVPVVFLSDSQKVYIYPTNQELTLKKNRDFTFSGRIHAGLFDFYARECSFDYDKFKLNLPTIDSLSFKVHSFSPDQYGRYPLVRVKTVISDLSGDLLIDHPNNKSGLKNYAEYPVFNSKNDAYVYYDKKSIQGGVYSRDKFNFHVYPFSIDSLDNFSTEGLEFDGYLTSAGIFPDIEEPLKVQSDYSLGFIKDVPASGYPIYGGKGIYFNKVLLSHRGLRGDGALEYLQSKSVSNDFIFHPDSSNAVLQDYTLAEQLGTVEYPSVTAQNVFQRWFPYEDIMEVSKIDIPIAMYNEEAKLHGKLVLTPQSLTGGGTMEFEDAEMDADLYVFKQHVFDADTADFRLKTWDLSELAFSTHNYKSHIDFEERKGEFVSNGGGSKVEFPVNQYICYMDEFEWYMDKEEIALQSSKNKMLEELGEVSNSELIDIDISGSEFVSVHPEQDSLRFYSSKARYNLRNNIIFAIDVRIIKVADAAIFPHDGNVTILKHAKMKTLMDAEVIANTTTKFHNIYDGIINIHSRKSYSGTGNYDYVDIEKKIQQIHFDKIAVDTTGQTYAQSHISDSLSFMLSPYFAFAGDVNLTASKEYLNFDGGYRIDHSCDTLGLYWVKFNTDVNPQEIYLPVDEDLKDINADKLNSALLFSTRYNAIYPSFLSKKINYSDEPIISAGGFVQFEDVTNEYRIASMDKLRQRTLPGNYLSLNKRKCIAKGDGKIELGADLGLVELQTYGNVEHHILTDSTEFELVMLLNFFFAENAIELISDELILANLTGIDLSKDLYTKALNEIVGMEEADKLLSQLNLYGAYRKIPDELIKTMLFADVKLKWNPITRSFISHGPIGIGSINKVQINKYADGYIQLTRKRSGDVLDIYLEVDNEWYYFNYSRNLMQAISSNKEFNTIIREIKSDKRTFRSKETRGAYRYIISTDRKKQDFLRKMQLPGD